MPGQESVERGRIQSVSRAIRLLMLVAGGSVTPTGKELAKAAGLAAPTAHHLLSTLVAGGLLVRDANAVFGLGPQIAVLAEAYDREVGPAEYLVEPLRRLVTETGETGYLAAWRRSDITILGIIEGKLPVRVSVPAGPYVDAHARATGKLLLALASPHVRDTYLSTHPLEVRTPRTITSPDALDAEFERVRELGYAEDDQEFQPGVSCLAMPLMQSGVVICSYSLSVPSERFERRRDELLKAMKRTVESVQPA